MQWDTSRNKVTREMTPVESAQLSRLYLVAFSQELSRRWAAEHPSGVKTCLHISK